MKTIRKSSNIKVLVVFFALLSGLVSCNSGNDENVLFTGDNYENIMQYIDADPEFSSFAKIVKAGKMTDVLSSYNNNGGNGYTLFLPTNEAVTKFINESDRYSSLDELLKDESYSAEIIRYHIVNGRIPSNEFPNGALANKTISNYYLTIVFREENSTISYAVNNESEVLTADIKKDNGTIHTIDKMLTPVVFTSYQWVEQSSDFTIFSELLSKSGLAESLNAFDRDELGREVYNEYTLFAESNALYAANGIQSFSDLVKAIDPSGAANQDYTNTANAVNKYARYHILEQSVFLDEFAAGVYNTYGDLPVSVDLDSIIKINMRTKIFDVVVNKGDTVRIDYLQVDLGKSNIVTRSGAIHQLDHLLYPFLPGLKTVTFEFFEEPNINALRSTAGSYYILEDDLDLISFVGTNYLIYTKSPTSISGCTNSDYIQVSGDVDFTFMTPKILAGRYTLKLVMQRGYSYLASLQAYVDDAKVGVVLDPTIDSATFNTFTLGTVELSDFTTHKVKLSTVIAGRMLIDRIIFQPI